MEKVEVSIGARIDELISEFQKASQGVTTSVDHISDVVKRSMSQVEGAANEASNALARMGQRSQQESQQVESSMGQLRGFLSGFMGQLAGIISIREITNEVVEFSERAESLNNVAQIAGTTATAISRLHNVAEPLGISSETVDKGMKKLARTLVDARRGGEDSALALAAVGIKGKDLKNLTLEQAVAKIADSFKGAEDGATKTALAQQLLGRSGADLIPMLNKGSEGIKNLGDEAERMGAVMSEDDVAAGAALDDALDKLHLTGQGFKNMLGKELSPALAFIAEGFTDSGGTAMDFGNVFKIVASIVVGATSIIKAAWTVVSSIVAGIATALISIVDATVKAAHMDFSGAKQALINGKDQIVGVFTDMNTDLGKLQDKTTQTFQNIWGGAAPKSDLKKPDTEGGTGELDFAAGGSGAGDAAKKAAQAEKEAAKDAFEYKMQQLRNELDALQTGAAQKLQIAQQMTALVKEQYGEQSKEYEAAKRDELRITKEVEAEKRRIQDQAMIAAKELADHHVAIERGNADYLLATGQINAVQRAAIEEQAQMEIYNIQLAYLQKRLELYAQEPGEVEKINQQIVQLKMDHEVQMQQLDLQHFEASKAQWDNYFQVVTDGFAGTIQGMILQGQTWQQAFGNLLQNLLGTFIQWGVKTLASHLTTEAAKTTATVAGASVRTAAEAMAAKQSVAANAGAAIKNIITKAAEVFANVYNAIAGIPYVGPFLAPVMAVAAGAAVIGLVGKVASAEGGWDRVPYDGAQAILHKEEMVLPAPLAEGLRTLIDNGGGGKGGVTIHALDRRDVARYFNDNGDMLMRALANERFNNPGGF